MSKCATFWAKTARPNLKDVLEDIYSLFAIFLQVYLMNFYFYLKNGIILIEKLLYSLNYKPLMKLMNSIINIKRLYRKKTMNILKPYKKINND